MDEKKIEQTEQQAVKTYTEEEKNELISKAVQDRLTRERKKYEEKLSEFENLQKELEELRRFKEEQELSKLSEVEQLQKKLESIEQEKQQYQKSFEDLQNELKNERITNKFRQLAQQSGIKYIDDALRLSDLSKVETDEDISNIVKSLVETKPFLLDHQPQKQAPIIGQSSNPTVRPDKTAEQLLEEARQRVLKERTTEAMIDYQRLKQKFSVQYDPYTLKIQNITNN